MCGMELQGQQQQWQKRCKTGQHTWLLRQSAHISCGNKENEHVDIRAVSVNMFESLTHLQRSTDKLRPDCLKCVDRVIAGILSHSALQTGYMCYTFELWWHVNADNPTGYLCHVDTYVSKDIHSHLISQNESRAGLLTVFSGAEHSRLLWNTGEYWKNRKGKQTFVVVLIPSSTVCFVNGTKNVITSIWRKDRVKGQRAELVCFHTHL